MKEIILAGGCFWGVEAYINTLKGIIATKVGYANGNTDNPTYEKVCKTNTGFAETCQISYDENITSLEKLLEAYWKIVDPTVENRQGHDIGSQYRTGIYFVDQKDLPIIINSKDEQQKKYNKAIVTEIEALSNFYIAEDYHQKYLDKNPNGYCHIPREMLKK